MSAVRLIPWPIHQAVVYLAGVGLVLAPFLMGDAEGGPLAVFVGAGVLLLAVGVLSKAPAGVAHLLPVPVHAGMIYLVGFFLVIAPFLFGFTGEPAPLTTSVLAGLGLLVVTLLTAFPASTADQEGQQAQV